MTTRLRTATCPLCKDTFDDAMLFSAHLAGAHGLVDDDGTETVIDEVEVEVEEPEPEALVVNTVESEPELAPEPQRMVVVSTPERVAPTSPTPSRLVMAAPAWLVLVVVVQLLIGIAGAATVGDDKDGEGTSVQTATGATPDADADTGADGEGPAASSGEPPAAPAPSAAPSTVNPLLDQQLADQALVRLGDLPRGWTVDEDTDADPAEDEAIAEAAGQGDCFEKANAPIAEEDGAMAEASFSKDLSGVFSQSQVFASEAIAHLGVQAARDVTPCLGEIIRASIQEEGGELTLSAMQPLGLPTFGDESIAITIQGTMIAPEIRVPFRLDGMIVRVDRTVSWTTAFVFGDSISSGDEKFLMEKVATRMAGEAA